MKDGVLPEARVQDVLRARITVPTGLLVIKIVEQLMIGPHKMLYEGKPVFIDTIRVKNKFKNCDPTHFRHFLLNLRLTYHGMEMIVEMQVHGEPIIGWNEKCLAHDLYDFFRSELQDDYAKSLDSMLEQAIQYFDKIKSTPVLLSMLVVIISARKDKLHKGVLPANAMDLYNMAIDTIIHQRCLDQDKVKRTRSMLRQVATENMTFQRRIFTTIDVNKALKGIPGAAGLWNEFHNSEQGIPLVKTLSEASNDLPSEYQFKHISFQESLFVFAIEDNEAPMFQAHNIAAVVACLGDRFLRNTFQIGGQLVVDKLVEKIPDHLDFFETPLTVSAFTTLQSCRGVNMEHTDTILRYSGFGLEGNQQDKQILSFQLISLAKYKSIEQLDLSHSHVKGDLIPLCSMRKLRVLKLESCKLLNGTLEPLQKLPDLKTLHLSHCTGLTGGLDPIGGLKVLEELSLSFASSLHCDLRIISTLISLRVLRMQSCNLKSVIDPISNLINLEVLHIPQNPFLQGNLKQLSHLLKLEDLDLCANTSIKGQFDDLSNLTGLKHLNMVDVSQLTGSLAFCTKLTVLETLQLQGGQMSGSLEPLANNLKLNYLKLVNLEGLTYTLEHLTQLSNLKTLFVQDAQIPGIETFKKKNPLCKVMTYGD